MFGDLLRCGLQAFCVGARVDVRSPMDGRCMNHYGKNFQPALAIFATALASIAPCATGSITKVNQ
jgi:hypothetical protein